MPKKSNNSTIARQWEMLNKLPRRTPGISASEMMEWLRDQGYEVTKRTVERDLRDLSTLFGIGSNEENTPFRWYWIPTARDHYESVELGEALSLVLCEKILSSLLSAELHNAIVPKLELAHKKLEALGDLPMAKWSKCVRFVPENLPFMPVQIKPAVLRNLQDAIVDERQIEIDYESFNQKGKKSIVHPFSFVQRGSRIYLVAFSEEHKDMRIFAAQRIKSVRVLNERVIVPKGFTIDKFIGDGNLQFGGGDTINLKAKLTAELASYLEESKINESQRINYENGTYVLHVKTVSSWQLWFWILSQGHSIEVLSPKSLREDLRNEIAWMAKNYK